MNYEDALDEVQQYAEYCDLWVKWFELELRQVELMLSSKFTGELQRMMLLGAKEQIEGWIFSSKQSRAMAEDTLQSLRAKLN